MTTVQVLKPKVYNFPETDRKSNYKRNRSVVRSIPNPESSIKARHKNQYNWKPLFLLHHKIVDFKIQLHHKPKTTSICRFDATSIPTTRNCFRGLKYKSQIGERKRPFTAGKTIPNFSSRRSVQEKRPPQRNFSTISFDEDESMKTRELKKTKRFSMGETYLSYRKKNRNRTIETEKQKKMH